MGVCKGQKTHRVSRACGDVWAPMVRVYRFRFRARIEVWVLGMKTLVYGIGLVQAKTRNLAH